MNGVKLTVTKQTRGKIDNTAGHGFIVMPDTYDVEQIDGGDVWILVDTVPDVCVVVSYAALGLVECPACDGRGEYSYRVCEDEWDTDRCDNCEGLGGVTAETAATMQDEMDEARSGFPS